MRRTASVLIITVLSLAFVLPAAALASTRDELPNDFGIELGGRSIVYTFAYQRMLNGRVGLEAGVSALGGGGDDEDTLIVFFPIGGKFYFVGKDGSPFVTAGVSIVNASFDSGPFDESETASYGYVGLGFEYRAQMGLLFRGTAYGLISDGSFFIWPGLYIGYAF
jgi:hypothetical protein